MSIADFRSDTLTTPTHAMREAMASAEVGDDVFEEDPTVKRLEKVTADLLGKEAGLFVPSGTMANQIGVKALTQPGDEIIAEAFSHVLTYEAGGVGLISGVQTRPVVGDHGIPDPEQIESAIRQENIHFPRTALVCLENTNNTAGGTVIPLSVMDQVRDVCQRHEIPILLDGARLFNASVAEGVSVREFASRADLAWIALSKGLSAPVGSVMCADQDLILRCRKIRKVLGGGMRQVGVLAAAGIVALETGVERISEDHERARALAIGVAELKGLEVDLEHTRTNMVRVVLTDGRASEVQGELEKSGVRALAISGDTLRFVTHRMIEDEHVVRAVDALKNIFG